MVTTAFLSMWVSNTATTSMMIPIGHAVLNELVKVQRRSSVAKEHGDKNGIHMDTNKGLSVKLTRSETEDNSFFRDLNIIQLSLFVCLG